MPDTMHCHFTVLLDQAIVVIIAQVWHYYHSVKAIHRAMTGPESTLLGLKLHTNLTKW